MNTNDKKEKRAAQIRTFLVVLLLMFCALEIRALYHDAYKSYRSGVLHPNSIHTSYSRTTAGEHTGNLYL